MPPSRATTLAEAGLLVVVLVWGLNFAVIKVPLEVMHPFTVNLLRFLVSVGVLGAVHAVMARQRGERFFDDLRRAPVAIIVTGVLGHVAYQLGFILGIDRTTAGMAALLLASNPLWTAAIAHLAGVERLRPAAWGGLAVSLAGVLVVILGRPSSGAAAEGAVVGAALLLGGALAWALFTVASRPILARGVSAVGLTFFGVAAAVPVLLALAAPTLGQTDWARTDALVWGALVFSGGLSTGFAYALWNIAVRQVGPSRTAAFGNLVPFVGVAAGALLLRESVPLVQLAGGALIVAGLVALRRVR
ncbi:MAG: DMT family transporter [Rubricoccaceae bacterium]